MPRVNDRQVRKPASVLQAASCARYFDKDIAINGRTIAHQRQRSAFLPHSYCKRAPAPMAPLDALPADVLTKCLDFVPFYEVHTTAKQVSRGLRSAARRALTKGRWRPLKLFCARGRDELFAAFELTGDNTVNTVNRWAKPVISDATRALLREAWALDAGECLLEVASWPPPEERFGPHIMSLEGAIRFLDVVVPSIDGLGQIMKAIACDRVRRVQPRYTSGDWVDIAPEGWMCGLINMWFSKVHFLNHDTDTPRLTLLQESQADLGLFTWADPEAAAMFLLRRLDSFVYNSYMRRTLQEWPNRREGELLAEVAEETLPANGWNPDP